MADISGTIDDVKDSADAVGEKKDEAKEVAEEAASNRWVVWIMRFGYIIRGILYIVVGLLSVQLALGLGGRTADKDTAISAIARQPFGQALLVLVAVGLVGYSLWGFTRAILDPLGKGTSPGGIARRIGYVVSGLSYGALLIPTIQHLAGAVRGESNGTKDVTAWLLAQPFGPWLVIMAGLIAIGGGMGQMYEAFKAGFKKDFKTREMTQEEMDWAVRAGRLGHAARGVVFGLTGFFLVQAGLHTNASEAKDLDGVLASILDQRYGPWLLGVVALGLISFGIFSMLAARWMQVTRAQAEQN